MNYTTDVQSREGAGVTDQQIADAINADPSRFKPVASNAVLEWLGGNGRKAKLDGFVAASSASTDAATVGLRSAIDVLLLAATNPTSFLTLDPTSDQRTLVNAAATLGIITADDAAALVAKAKLLPDVTAADVTATRTAYTAQQAIAALNLRWADVHNAIAAGIDDGTLADWAAVQSRIAQVMA